MAASDSRQRSILPLPEKVVAQIKSSAAVASLSQVVLGLIGNSLDAKATKIDATIDFARGSCTIEDDGLGIFPLDFREQGGLGKLYCTSKHNSQEPCLGRNGTFLASLAAVSLLTIISHHRDYCSQNSITFHHSATVERQLPALAQHEIHGKHGTRVTVRNLFGNLPVRVKQRSLILEQKSEHDRIWENLKRDIVGLLLSWQGPVLLKVRDADNKTAFSFNTSIAMASTISNHKGSIEEYSTKRHSMLNILTQANYITITDWSSWVPAAASTSSVTISGAISLEPAPSKRTQFISIGLRPIPVDAGYNELYNEVNRRFALSSFGTIEDSLHDENEQTRRESDKRYNGHGYTKNQLRARKGVDRHPMFHLRISLKNAPDAKDLDECFLNNNINLQAVIDVLNAMITQWLSVHHIRQKTTRARRIRTNSGASSMNNSDEETSPSTAEMQAQTSSSSTTAVPAAGSQLPKVDNRKRKRIQTLGSSKPSERLPCRAFAEWSRIKSGRSEFFHSTSPSLKPGSEKLALPSTAPSSRNVTPERFARFSTEPIPRGAYNPPSHAHDPSDVEKDQSYIEDKADDTMLWTDPLTNMTFLLNARTGCVVRRQDTRPHSEDTASIFTTPFREANKPLRLTPRVATSESANTPWIKGVLESWENPVFRPSEKHIPQISSLEQQSNKEGQTHSHHFEFQQIDMERAFGEATMTGKSKLSKNSLRNAYVIAQLDKKFILTKMKSSNSSVSGTETEMLVLIDQHAADERIRVELLLAKLCRPLPESRTGAPFRSKCGHTSQVDFVILEKPICYLIEAPDRKQFIAHAASFAAWGILFDIDASKEGTADFPRRTLYSLSITTLPPAISERCKADPQALISFLRSTVWKYAEGHFKPSLLLGLEKDDAPSSWVRRLASCPQGLIDLINSRACRSAIMFNDTLSLEECTELVTKLANCVFPFMCAHGRPSMVPIFDINSIGEKLEGLSLQGSTIDDASKPNFINTWKNWKKS